MAEELIVFLAHWSLGLTVYNAVSRSQRNPLCTGNPWMAVTVILSKLGAKKKEERKKNNRHKNEWFWLGLFWVLVFSRGIFNNCRSQCKICFQLTLKAVLLFKNACMSGLLNEYSFGWLEMLKIPFWKELPFMLIDLFLAWRKHGEQHL